MAKVQYYVLIKSDKHSEPYKSKTFDALWKAKSYLKLLERRNRTYGIARTFEIITERVENEKNILQTNKD